jgi:hypothetical protein
MSENGAASPSIPENPSRGRKLLVAARNLVNFGLGAFGLTLRRQASWRSLQKECEALRALHFGNGCCGSDEVFREETIQAWDGRFGPDYEKSLRTILHERCGKAVNFLEWGAGNSSAIILDFLGSRQDAFFLVIDHDEAYLAKAAAALKFDPRLHVRCLPLAGYCRGESDPEPNYASYPRILGRLFDFVYVDGRRRLECVLNAGACLSDNGIIVLHDYARQRYGLVRSLFDQVEIVGPFLALGGPVYCGGPSAIFADHASSGSPIGADLDRASIISSPGNSIQST